MKLDSKNKIHILFSSLIFASLSYLLYFLDNKYKYTILISFIFYSYIDITFLRFLLNEKFIKLPKFKNLLYFYLTSFICSAISLLPLAILNYKEITSNTYIVISITALTTYLMSVTYPSLTKVAKFERIKLNWKPSKKLIFWFYPIAFANYFLFYYFSEFTTTQIELCEILNNILIFLILRVKFI